MLNLFRQPAGIAVLVFCPHLPLALVVFELGLIHHCNALVHRADRLTDPAAATCLHVGVIKAIWSHIEAGIRALEPAEGALGAFGKVDRRSHRAGGELLEIGIALRPVAPVIAFKVASQRNGPDHQSLFHTLPARHGEAEGDFRTAFIGLNLSDLHPFEGFFRRSDFQIVLPLFADRRFESGGAEEVRRHAGKRAQHPHVRVVILVNPKSREARLPFDNGEIVGNVLFMDMRNQLFGALCGGHNQSAVFLEQLVDRLETVPGPGLNPFAQGVVNGDGNIHFRRLILGDAPLKLLVVGRHNGKLFGRDAVSFRRISVAAKGDPHLPLLSCR